MGKLKSREDVVLFCKNTTKLATDDKEFLVKFFSDSSLMENVLFWKKARIIFRMNESFSQDFYKEISEENLRKMLKIGGENAKL